MRINKGITIKPCRLHHCQGALPRANNAGSSPIMKAVPTKPTSMKAKAIDIPANESSRKAAKPMPNIVKGDNLGTTLHLAKELNHLYDKNSAEN